MRLSVSCVLSLAFASTSAIGCALPADSGSGALEEEPRRELYQATDRIEVRAASVDLYSINSVDLQARRDGSYELLSVPFTIVNEDPSGPPLCPDASFYGQPRLYAGATAFLVGEDLALTAGHAMQNQATCDGRALIFDRALFEPSDPTREHPILAAEDVFFCRELVATGYPAHDWSLVRLDRAVGADRVPLKIRREGTLGSGVPVVLLGHPHRLPLKIESTTGSGYGSTVYGPGTIAVGSSGSMVVSHDAGRVEGLIVSGYLPPPVLDPVEGCYRECTNCGGSFSATGASQFASIVPVVGLEVAPASVQLHYGPPGGPFTDPIVQYTLSAGATGRPVQHVESGSEDGLIEFGPSLATASRRLPPGGSLVVTARLNAELAASLAIGEHDAAIQFDDRTYLTSDEREHRVLVGVDGFGVETATGARRGVTYSLSNRYDIGQEISVSADVDWLRIAPTELALPPRNSDAPQPTVVVTLAIVPATARQIATVTFRSAWHTETRHIEWDGGRLIPLD